MKRVCIYSILVILLVINSSCSPNNSNVSYGSNIIRMISPHYEIAEVSSKEVKQIKRKQLD